MFAALSLSTVPDGQAYNRHERKVVVVVVVSVVVSVVDVVSVEVVTSVVVVSVVVVGAKQQTTLLWPTVVEALGMRRVPPVQVKPAHVKSQHRPSDEIDVALAFRVEFAAQVKLAQEGTQHEKSFAPKIWFARLLEKYSCGQAYMPQVTSQHAPGVVPASTAAFVLMRSPIGHVKALHAESQQFSSCGMLPGFCFSTVSAGQLKLAHDLMQQTSIVLAFIPMVLGLLT